MEALKKYWPYLLIGVVVIIFLIKKSGGGQAQVISLAPQQSGDLAATQSAERVQQSSIAASVFSQLLGYDIAKKNAYYGYDVARQQTSSQESLGRAALQEQGSEFQTSAAIERSRIAAGYSLESTRISEGSALQRLMFGIQQMLGLKTLESQTAIAQQALENERKAAKGQKNVALAGIASTTTLGLGQQTVQSQAIEAQRQTQMRKALFDFITGLASTFNPMSLLTGGVG